jgi:hypothetical protein
VCASSHSVCTNTVGSFTCSCSSGFVGGGTDSSPCVDVNECAQGGGVSEQCSAAHETCVNSVGSFACGCDVGYESGHDGCMNVNECAEQGGAAACPGNNTQCADTDGSFTCSCAAGFAPPAGYELVGGLITWSDLRVGCVDVDECAVTQGLCVRRQVRAARIVVQTLQRPPHTHTIHRLSINTTPTRIARSHVTPSYHSAQRAHHRTPLVASTTNQQQRAHLPCSTCARAGLPQYGGIVVLLHRQQHGARRGAQRAQLLERCDDVLCTDGHPVRP